MSLTKEEETELITLQEYIINKETVIYQTRIFLRKSNEQFNKAKKRAKELMNKE